MLAAEFLQFPELLRDRAAGAAAPPARAMVAGAHSAEVLEGVRLAVNQSWIEPVLIGPPDRIRKAARQIN